MPEIIEDPNGGSGGQADPDPDKGENDPGGDPNNPNGSEGEPKPGEGDPGNPGAGEGDPVMFIDSIPEGDREGFQDFEGKSVEEFVSHYKKLQDGKVVVPETYEAIESIEIKNQENYDVLSKFCKDDLGLTQDQFTKLLPAMVKRDQAVLNEFQKSITDMNDKEFSKVLEDEKNNAIDSLTREWGGDYEKKRDSATGLVAALADDDFVEFLTDTGLGNDPRMMKAFYKLSTYLSEDSFVEGKVEENDVKRDPQTGAPMLKFKKME